MWGCSFRERRYRALPPLYVDQLTMALGWWVFCLLNQHAESERGFHGNPSGSATGHGWSNFSHGYLNLHMPSNVCEDGIASWNDNDNDNAHVRVSSRIFGLGGKNSLWNL